MLCWYRILINLFSFLVFLCFNSGIICGNRIFLLSRCFSMVECFPRFDVFDDRIFLTTSVGRLQRQDTLMVEYSQRQAVL